MIEEELLRDPPVVEEAGLIPVGRGPPGDDLALRGAGPAPPGAGPVPQDAGLVLRGVVHALAPPGVAHALLIVVGPVVGGSARALLGAQRPVLQGVAREDDHLEGGTHPWIGVVAEGPLAGVTDPAHAAHQLARLPVEARQEAPQVVHPVAPQVLHVPPPALRPLHQSARGTRDQGIQSLPHAHGPHHSK